MLKNMTTAEYLAEFDRGLAGHVDELTHTKFAHLAEWASPEWTGQRWLLHLTPTCSVLAPLNITG